MDEQEPVEGEFTEYPLDGVLDLHTFIPGEAAAVVRDYLGACREKGILNVRIIHGKGTGQLRRTVHGVLARLPEVISFRLAGEDRGGWGSTLVDMRLPAEQPTESPDE